MINGYPSSNTLVTPPGRYIDPKLAAIAKSKAVAEARKHPEYGPKVDALHAAIMAMKAEALVNRSRSCATNKQVRAIRHKLLNDAKRLDADLKTLALGAPGLSGNWRPVDLNTVRRRSKNLCGDENRALSIFHLIFT